MPLYVVQTRYTEDRDKLAAVRPAHRAYLLGLVDRGTVLAAGPWADDLGSLVVYQVADQDELATVLGEDPYTLEGVAAERTTREWIALAGTWL